MRTCLYLFLLLFIGISCGPSEAVIEEEEEPRPLYETEEERAEEDLADAELDEFEQLLFSKRSQLTDRFAVIELEIPEAYLAEIVTEEQDSDPYAGFRVQLISTRNVAEADSIRDDFRAWASSRVVGYEPEAYVYFRQPTYRVRVGDFQDRNRAIEFSRIVRTRYSEAWVVHDRIEPDRVPADTTDIRLLDRSQIELLNIPVE